MNAIAPPSGAPASGPALDNRRVLAGLIDLAVIGAGVFVLATLFSMVNGTDLSLGPPIIAVALAWGLYYYFALESGDGQTLGKKVMKLRVVRADGGTTSMRDVAVRTVVRLLDFPMMYLVGLVTMMVTKEKRQRLGDIVAGTLVVDAAATPSPAAPAAVAAVAAPAAAGPQDGAEGHSVEDDALDRPADAPPVGEPSFPVAKSPVDVGAPLEGMSAPERPGVPQVTAFDPNSPASPAEEPHAEEAAAPQVEVLSDVQAPDPVVEVTPEPMDAPPTAPPVQAYPSEPPAEEPSFPAPAAEEPAMEEPVVEEPVVEPAAEQPVVDEPPAEEPAVEEPVVEEPVVEPAAEQPVVDEPPAEEPAVEEPVVEEPVVEPAAQPSAEPAPAESSADQSFSGPAADVPSEAPVEEPTGEPAPEEPRVELAPNGDDGADRDDQVTVKPVETVSAMDLIMGDDDEAQSEQDNGPAGA